MGISMLTVKPNLTPHDQLRLLEAWEAWGVPIEQQQAWRVQIFGVNCFVDVLNYQTYEALTSKEDQLELPLEYPETLQNAPTILGKTISKESCEKTWRGKGSAR